MELTDFCCSLNSCCCAFSLSSYDSVLGASGRGVAESFGVADPFFLVVCDMAGSPCFVISSGGMPS